MNYPLIIIATGALALAGCTGPGRFLAGTPQQSKPEAPAPTASGGTLGPQAAELRATLGGNGIEVAEAGPEIVVTIPGDALFATGSTTVQPAMRQPLAALARSLDHYPLSRVTILGHTDNAGSAGRNQDLSFRRAQAVETALLYDGVRADRLIAIGRGESKPIASNLTPEGRAQNRRVEIRIDPNANP